MSRDAGSIPAASTKKPLATKVVSGFFYWTYSYKPNCYTSYSQAILAESVTDKWRLSPNLANTAFAADAPTL